MANANYVDKGSQTIWAGLTQQSVRPEILFSPPKDTSTPPAEMITEKSQFPNNIPSITESHYDGQNKSMLTLLERRKNHPGLVSKIPLPASEFDNDVPLSPPPTHALLSPLPEANRRDAGHTPLVPRALSPDGSEAHEEQAVKAQFGKEQPRKEDRSATPDADQGLKGPLTLPSNPLDGAQDNFGIQELDQVLSKIAKQQAILRGDFDDEPKPTSTAVVDPDMDEETILQRRRERSARGSRTVDGVALKSPPSNFGAPMGSL
jgi:hypothetical protein